MKIVQIIDNLWIGGAQSLLITLAKALDNNPDMELSVISLDEQHQHAVITSQLATLGVKIVHFSGSNMLSLRRLWRLTQYLRSQKISVVHTHLSYANILGAVAGRMAKLPIVATIHSSKEDPTTRFYAVHSRIETFVLRHLARTVIAVGHLSANENRRRIRDKDLVILPNAIAPLEPLAVGERRSIRADLIGDAEMPLLLAVGRLVHDKGFADLFSAFTHVVKAHPTAQLIVAGEGPIHAKLNALIVSLDLTGNVRMLGSRQDVPRLLAASDIFVNASHTEGLSIAILEAMAAGLPIIATDVGDTPRVVVEGTGLLVPPHQPAALADAMIRLLDHPEERTAFGNNAQEFVDKHHNFVDWSNSMFSLYRGAA